MKGTEYTAGTKRYVLGGDTPHRWEQEELGANRITYTRADVPNAVKWSAYKQLSQEKSKRNNGSDELDNRTLTSGIEYIKNIFGRIILLENGARLFLLHWRWTQDGADRLVEHLFEADLGECGTLQVFHLELIIWVLSNQVNQVKLLQL